MARHLTVALFKLAGGPDRTKRRGLQEPGARLHTPGAAAVPRILQRLKSFKLTLSARR
jgi:hypothetical protein